MIKEKVDKFFNENLVYEDNMDYYINSAIDFIEWYDKFFDEISKEIDFLWC